MGTVFEQIPTCTRPKRISPSLTPPRNRWRLGRTVAATTARGYGIRRFYMLTRKQKSIFLCRDQINIAHFLGERTGNVKFSVKNTDFIFNKLSSNPSSSAVLGRQITAATGTNVTVLLLLLLLLVNRRGFWGPHIPTREKEDPP